MRRALLAIAVVIATGCSEKATIRPEGAADSVTSLVAERTGFRPTDVECPSGVEAKVGGRFECRFTGPEGPYVAHMEILSVEGERVDFRIDTEPVR